LLWLLADILGVAVFGLFPSTLVGQLKGFVEPKDSAYRISIFVVFEQLLKDKK
jgi:uncharacterized membrane protein YesL